MLSHSLRLVVFLLLWATYSGTIQANPVGNKSHNKLDSDVFSDLNVTRPEGTIGVSLVPENDTFEGDLASPQETSNATRSPLESENLFEGDLAIPRELIEEYYGNATRDKRGAVKNNNRLWFSGRVYYRYARGVSSYVQRTIRRAIDYYETHTCLRFHRRSYQRDYIEFTTVRKRDNEAQCYSDYIGCKGGKQIINLGPGCQTRGIALHEIGHAIGFWHEQSRPDRDSYVKIIESNVIPRLRYNFQKRTDIDSHGFAYDYGSIMHYGVTAFSKDKVRLPPTIQVTNWAAYISQGYPTIGQRSHLSSGDIAQVNRLYDNCPSPARLRIYALEGHNLPDLDGFWAKDSDPYMDFVAYDLYGGSLRKKTRKVQNNNSPKWYEWLEFGTRVWKKFTVKVWDSDIGRDDSISSTHTFYISPGPPRTRMIHWRSRGGWVRFRYYYG